MDTFFGMRLFAQTVQSGSFSEAGRTLGMAPSSVSRQISMLEDRLGVRLLNRSTRQLHLTEAGQIYYDRTTNILHAVEDANLAARLNAMFFAVKQRHAEPFSDAEPVLKELAGKYRTALLTNGNTDPAQYGLDRYLDPIVHAATEGVAKPDPASFSILLERAGVEAHEVVYIGDSLSDDVAGAQSARIRSIWLNRNGVEREGDVMPDAEVRSLAEVPAVVDRWSDVGG